MKKRVGRLAAHTKRSTSHLAGRATADGEPAVVEGIEQGLQDMHAGRVVSHSTAMQRLRATVARTAKDKS